jgi:hypothetical protein
MKWSAVSASVLLAIFASSSFHSRAAETGSTRPASAAPASSQPALEQYNVKLLITRPKNPVSEPMRNLPVPGPDGATMAICDGREGQFSAGGEFPFGVGAQQQYYSYGIEITAIAHRIAADKLIVCLHAAHNDLGDKPTYNNLDVRECGLRIIREIKPGDTLSMDLGGGWTVKATITD